jgi:hypothetical protein
MRVVQLIPEISKAHGRRLVVGHLLGVDKTLIDDIDYATDKRLSK